MWEESTALAISTDPVDGLVDELRRCEAEVSRLRARQAVLLGRLERAQAPMRDRSRSMQEWTAAALDVSAGTARDLVYGARWLPFCRPAGFSLADGLISFDRAVVSARLAAAVAGRDRRGSADVLVRDSFDLDLSGVRRLAARHQRMSSRHEREIVGQRYMTVQPSLDESSWRLFGVLAGVDGKIVDQALAHRADELGRLPYGADSTAGQRRADALVAMAQDSLDTTTTGEDADVAGGGGGGRVCVFVDLAVADGTGGELGAEVEYAPRVGPETLRELLCTGSVQVIGIDEGRPVAASPATRAIPPALRRYVSWRDGACVIDGCASRYRLQVHHIRPWSRGGTHDPDNLATVCWYHHHVVIHGMGYTIDPDSRPKRRHLRRPPPDRGPP